ncbi:MAG: response regulator [Bacteroidota bacterium]
MNRIIYNILLADDDEEDSSFFQIALDELFFPAKLNVVRNGVQLLSYLKSKSSPVIDILFLDLNLPLKSGVECLEEIRNDQNLKKLLIAIFSTSFHLEYIDNLYKMGATFYIQKPGDFSKFKKVIQKALVNSAQIDNLQPKREDFIIKP